MLATFIIETVLALYTVARYKLDALGRLTVLMLLGLAVFQLCEYHVCGGWGVRASEWSRGGYVAITLLPPLGLHMLHVLAGKPGRKLVALAYATMVAFVAYFTVVPHVFNGYACTGNYVIFQIGTRPALAYGAYYYGWLLTAIVLGIRWSGVLKKKGAKAKSRMFAVQALVLAQLPAARVIQAGPAAAVPQRVAAGLSPSYSLADGHVRVLQSIPCSAD